MRRFIMSLSFLLVAVMALAGIAIAQGMEGSVLFVAPHRLIITPVEKSETINVSNKSSEARRYDLMVVDQVMTPEGVTQRSDNGPYSAKKMLDYRPKRFTLKPGDSQVVRVVVTRPAGLGDGDYHSHLMFREVPLGKKDKENLPQDAKAADKTVTFEIRTLYGLGVPIIVQQGKVAADIDMGEASVGGGSKGHVLSVTFTRSGNAEAAGKISAEYVQGGKAVSALDPQWVRMYREADKISKKFDLKLPANASGGKLVVSLMRDESDPKKTIKKEVAVK
ncbi:MAG: hypothetical protein ACAH83_10325 [Alphaproteobacteria bacterium]